MTIQDMGLTFTGAEREFLCHAINQNQAPAHPWAAPDNIAFFRADYARSCLMTERPKLNEMGKVLCDGIIRKLDTHTNGVDR